MKRAKKTINHLLHVLEYAPGVDLVEYKDWETLHRNLLQARDEIDKVMDVTGLYPAPLPMYVKEG